MRFMAVFLLVVPMAIAQHSGGFARGNAGGRGFAGHGTITRRTTPGSAGGGSGAASLVRIRRFPEASDFGAVTRIGPIIRTRDFTPRNRQLRRMSL